MVTAVGGPKGGTGKSTLAVQIASSYAQMGATVLLLDCDENNKHSIAWFKNRPRCLHQRIHVRMVNDPDMLGATIEQEYTRYDHIVIDSPPTLKHMVAKIALEADYMVIPVFPGFFDLESFNDLGALFFETTQRRRSRLPAYIVFNRDEPKLERSKEIRKAITERIAEKEELGMRLSEINLAKRGPYSDCNYWGLSIVQYGLIEKNSATKLATAEWNQFFEGMLQDIKDRIYTPLNTDPGEFLSYEKYLAGARENFTELKAFIDDLKEQARLMIQGKDDEDTSSVDIPGKVTA